jgi:hypothetical protein
VSIRRWPILAVVLLATAALPAAARAADRAGELTEDAASYTWSGAKATAIAPAFYGFVGEPCTKAPVGYCDETLVHVTLPDGAEHGSISVAITGDGDDDFDLYLYSSDADGSTGDQLKYSNGEGTGGETVGYNLTESGWYLAKVVYFDVTDSSYAGRAELHLPEGTKIEPAPKPETSTAVSGGEPQPPPQPQSRPAAAPAAAPPPPTLTQVRRRRRSVTGRVHCELACAVQLNALAGRRRVGRVSIRLGAGDSFDFLLPTRTRRRAVTVQAHVLEASGRMTTLARRAAA